MKRLWRIPARVVEYRDIAVEAESQAEALKKFRALDWVESFDPDDTRTEVFKTGPITLTATMCAHESYCCRLKHCQQ